jgi:hypothetical protein
MIGRFATAVRAAGFVAVMVSYFALAFYGTCAAGCAALPAIASIFGAAVPVVTAIDQQLRRAQVLAPTLSPDRPDEAALLGEIVRRLDTLDACQANATAAIAPDAGASDAARTTAALIDAAAALRGLVDAIAAAQPARADAGSPEGAP